MTPKYDSEWPEGEPDEELADLIGWGWQHVPGLVLAWGITHKDSMLDAIRKERAKPHCPYCEDTRLRFNPRPTRQYDEGDLFHCEGCGGEGESINLIETTNG